MRKNSLFKIFRTPFLAIFSFLIGCMFTVNIMPIEKTCKVEDTDREYNIMKNSKLKNPELIIFILSAPKNIEKRQVIRETWLKLYRTEVNEIESFKVKHYFVVGNLELNSREKMLLNKEQSLFSDILILPIHDTYKNLTEKLKSSFEWLDEQYDFGLLFKYVLKCDDDSFVNLDNFLKQLMQIENHYLKSDFLEALKLFSDNKNDFLSFNVQINNKYLENGDLSLYWGYFSGTARIKTRGKWKETEWIASDRYIPYALGGGYLLSRNMVSFIAKNAKNLRSFRSEDVSVGLWLAPVNNILRIHDIRFDTEWTSRGCKNTNLVIHNVDAKLMKIIYNNLVRHNKMCSKENIRRTYYVYDWAVPPSQCCKSPQEDVIELNKH